MSARGIVLITGAVGVVIVKLSVFYSFFGIGVEFFSTIDAMLSKAKLD
jgi:hypothetical protein